MNLHTGGALKASIPQPISSSDHKPADDSSATTSKSAQSFVTCGYKAKVGEICREVTITWSKNLMNHSLTITVLENPFGENHYTCKIDLKAWQFWGKKGLKSFDVCGKRVDIFWDLRSAKFSSSPEPCSDYYVAMVSSEEVVLLLGDLKKEAFKRTKTRPSLVEPILVYKRENVYGKKLFCTRTMLDDEGKKEHDIVIENSLSGPGDPEMWISVDGTLLIRIMNLNWRFRGNETVVVNNVPVHIFWDVYNWLFNSPGLGHGLFIFKPGEPPDCTAINDRNGRGCGGELEVDGDGKAQFSHFLYAWRVE